ncbi:hypothetical protein GGI04_003519 [Coemansia thaxteri]|uniref:RING-type domain-containing protein n=1 Tax=Coemansia thaxteri TaxID=2663907 RepID=A0A9W8BBK4_9FUNG|nr:hypothetical protein H4R26_004201 [Coemansia thaxteri]KAJ2002011.1 hypothetical protein GGI04_003519 [Coemansia thaxteri]KAJ2470880.1 hypothetical protein GGI02_002642 [Coemansia sp. RSA 2322]KAJ2481047.1 hypothetical protein EV174_003571 [Coemansia sp. RSA 2320]
MADANFDPGTMNAEQQYALATSLYPGQSLSPYEVKRIINLEIYKAQHRGHEGKHYVMFLILVGVLGMLPATVKFWRRRHPSSYRFVSTASICLIPLCFAASNGYYRFVCAWMVYAVANTYVLFLATRSPLSPRTPRRVYQWFALINKASYAVFVVGIVMFALCAFNAIPGLTDSERYVEASLLTVFYGLYYGLMSRDLVTLCTDRMAATLGYAGISGQLPTKHLPQDVCCICGGGLGGGREESERGMLAADASPEQQETSTLVEPMHRLECGHEFHASCIRGWCVIGKKDMCPFCREKVDLELFKQNPWDKQELFYVAALEYMRFFISWQPLTLLLLAGVFWVLGLS